MVCSQAAFKPLTSSQSAQRLRCRVEEERLRRSHKEPFPLRWRLKSLGLLHRFPPLSERFGSRPRPGHSRSQYPRTAQTGAVRTDQSAGEPSASRSRDRDVDS
jgi:hypothetical protein